MIVPKCTKKLFGNSGWGVYGTLTKLKSFQKKTKSGNLLSGINEKQHRWVFFLLKQYFRKKIKSRYLIRRSFNSKVALESKLRLIVRRSIFVSLLVVHAQLDETNFPNYTWLRTRMTIILNQNKPIYLPLWVQPSLK